MAVDGKPVVAEEQASHYLALNKPAGLSSAPSSDAHGRPLAASLFKPEVTRAGLQRRPAGSTTPCGPHLLHQRRRLRRARSGTLRRAMSKEYRGARPTGACPTTFAQAFRAGHRGRGETLRAEGVTIAGARTLHRSSWSRARTGRSAGPWRLRPAAPQVLRAGRASGRVRPRRPVRGPTGAAFDRELTAREASDGSSGRSSSMIVAMDGPAGTGKSTIARMVAERARLHLRQFRQPLPGHDLRPLSAAGIDLRGSRRRRSACAADSPALEYRDGRVYLDGRGLSRGLLRTDAVDAGWPRSRAIVPVRHVVNERGARPSPRQRTSWWRAGTSPPSSSRTPRCKIYLDASVEARARRRLRPGDQRASAWRRSAQNIEMRDGIDRNKAEGTLERSPEAFYLDTSHLTIEEVYEKVNTENSTAREHVWA
ncbi:MAG: (d)CMP kinase [Bacillus subtilis]|nr:(d)CMP kinase [Bacillus subtilis]